MKTFHISESNWFAVTNVREFIAAMESYDAVVEVNPEGSVRIRGQNGIFKWETAACDFEPEDVIAPHLDDAATCVITSVGYSQKDGPEGYAVSFTKEAKPTFINLTDICEIQK
mgnify:FL=1